MELFETPSEAPPAETIRVYPQFRPKKQSAGSIHQSLHPDATFQKGVWTVRCYLPAESREEYLQIDEQYCCTRRSYDGTT